MLRVACLILFLFLISSSAFSALQVATVPPGGKLSKDQKTHAKAKGGEPSAEEFKEGEILLKFKKGVASGRKDKFHKKHGSKIIKEFRSDKVEWVKLKKGLSVEEAVSLYGADPDVEYVAPNYRRRARLLSSDPRFNELCGMHNTGQTGGTADADIDAPAAWDIATGDDGVVLAIIDTGIDYNHQDLAGNVWTNPGEIAGNGVDDDGNGYVDDVHGIDTCNGDSDPMDDAGHGSHVAGTIGAVGGNGVGVAGVNWNVSMVACKFLDADGYGDDAGAIGCLDYVKALRDRGENIVVTSNSWGGGGNNPALAAAIDAQREILFVAAAGNDGRNNDVTPSYPDGYDLPSILAVAATDHEDGLAWFSNYGRQTVHLGAPGVDILSSTPGNNYELYSGTSMATPHVSGLAALLAAQDAGRDWRALRNLMLAGADGTAAMEGVTITGRRLNAAGALGCTDSPLLAVVQYPGELVVGVPETLEAISINCGAAVGPVSVDDAHGGMVQLADDGVAPDQAAGDGVFVGTWTPTSGSDRLTFSSPAGSETFDLPPLEMVPVALYHGSVEKPFSVFLQAEGGQPPYAWSLTWGSLPPGLVLDGASGEIAGTPEASGVYAFSVQAGDTLGATAGADLSLVVNSEFELWSRHHAEGYENFGAGVAVLPDGSIVVAGKASGNILLLKYDGDGNLLWSRTFDRSLGGGANDLAVDAAGAIYVAARVYGTQDNDFSTVKFDPQGELLWQRTYDGGAAEEGVGIALDGEGGVYVTGPSGDWGQYDFLTVKYDEDGNQLWARSYDSGAEDEAVAVAADASGVYVAGTVFISPQDLGNGTVVRKYDLEGNLLWSGSYGLAGYGSFGSDLELDGGGNLYLAGECRLGPGSSDFLVVKIGAGGNQLWARGYDHLSDEYAEGVGVDPRGRVHVTGVVLNGADHDVLTVSYDAAGNRLGVNGYGGEGYDYGYAVAADGLGGIVVTGRAADDSVLTVKYLDAFGIGTLQVANGQQGVPYAQELVAAQGVPPYTWSLAAGSLPPGLSLDGAGATITGVPTEQGDFTFTLQATDAAAATASRAYTISVYQGLQIVTASLPSAFYQASYQQTLAGSGGLPPYAWTIAAGVLPEGLLLDAASGELGGVPLETGSFDFTVRLTDVNGFTAERAFSLPVGYAPLSVTTSAPPPAPQGASYSEPLAASGGLPPYAWTLTGGALPAGLALDGVSGVIAGTASELGTYAFTVEVADARAVTATCALSITVSSEPVIQTASLPWGIAVAPYAQTLEAAGGTPPYAWTLIGGSLPTGLALDATSGELAGTPAERGPFAFTAAVADGQFSSSRELSLEVRGPPHLDWVQAYSGWGERLALGPAGNIYVLGEDTLLKYTAAGVLLWSASWEAWEGARLTVAADGSVYVAGNNIQTPQDMILAKYDSAGGQLWLRHHGNNVEARGVALGPQGQVYVLGVGRYASSPSFVVTFAAAGTPLGEEVLTEFYYYGIATDTGGDIYLTGKLVGGGPLIARYGPSWEMRWWRNLPSTSGEHLTVDADGNVFVIGYSRLYKYSGGGSLRWSRSLPGSGQGYGLALGSEGHIYVAQDRDDHCGIALYDPDGNELWTELSPDRRFCKAIAVDGQDNFYTAGSEYNGHGWDIRTRKYLAYAPPLEATGPALAAARAGTPYTAELVAGGWPPIAWELVAGALPAGLSADTAGSLAGTPEQAGSYAFTLQATDADDQQATGSYTLEVAPDADFTAAPLAGEASLPVSFTDASLGGPTAWIWDFGDGGSSSEQNPVHVYAAPGVYSVSITATAGGAADTVTLTDLISVQACGSGPVRLSAGGDYADIPSALSAALDGDTVMLLDQVFDGDVVFDSSGDFVTLRGGYGCGFDEPPGSESTLNGSLKVRGGSLKLDRLRIR